MDITGQLAGDTIARNLRAACQNRLFYLDANISAGHFFHKVE